VGGCVFVIALIVFFRLFCVFLGAEKKNYLFIRDLLSRFLSCCSLYSRRWAARLLLLTRKAQENTRVGYSSASSPLCFLRGNGPALQAPRNEKNERRWLCVSVRVFTICFLESLVYGVSTTLVVSLSLHSLKFRCWVSPAPFFLKKMGLFERPFFFYSHTSGENVCT